jgi:hypothetical protein
MLSAPPAAVTETPPEHVAAGGLTDREPAPDLAASVPVGVERVDTYRKCSRIVTIKPDGGSVRERW